MKHTTIRIKWIDAARAFGILSIMVSHMTFISFPKIWWLVVNPWNIVLFPFLGGMIVSRQGLFMQIKHKFISLIVPYIASGVMSMFGWMVLGSTYPFSQMGMLSKQSIVMYLVGFAAPFNGPLWFIPPYFIAHIIYALLNPYWKNIREYKKIFFLIIVGFIFFYIKKPAYFFSIDIAVLFLLFLLLGNEFYQKRRIFFRSKLIFISILFLFIIATYTNGPVRIYMHEFQHPVLFFISSTSGCVLVSYFFHILAKKGFIFRLVSIGQKSLYFYIFHWPILQWTTYLFYLAGIIHKVELNVSMTVFHIQSSYPFLWAGLGLSCTYLYLTYLVSMGLQKLYSRITA